MCSVLIFNKYRLLFCNRDFVTKALQGSPSFLRVSKSPEARLLIQVKRSPNVISLRGASYCPFTEGETEAQRGLQARQRFRAEAHSSPGWCVWPDAELILIQSSVLSSDWLAMALHTVGSGQAC